MSGVVEKAVGYSADGPICKTEIGDLPIDWSLQLLGKLIHSVEYGSSAKSDAVGDIPVLRMGNMQDGKLDWNDLVFTSDQTEIKKYWLSKGDVLFNRTNTIELVGKCAIFEAKRPAIFAGYLIRINCDPAKLDSRYLTYIMSTEFARKHSLKVLSVAVGQANINGQKVKTYPIPIPPTLAEQEAIASALSDADALIESLEQLLAKKRLIKQGAMQELLTGTRRLPGFDGEWTEKAIGSEVDLLTGFPFPSSQYSEFGVRLLRGSNIKRGVTDWNAEITQYWPEITPDIRVYELAVGDIVIAMDGSLVGRSFAQLGEDDLPAILLQRVARLRSHSIDLNYLKSHICSPFFTAHCDKLKTVTAIPHISPRDIREFVISVPPTLREQREVAAILSDMEQEIMETEKRLAKARQLKQAMMQQLLTGRIRLA